MRIRTTILSVFLTLFLMGGGFVAAQAPADEATQAEATAYTLDSADLPTGYTLTGETFLTAPDATTLPGLQAVYVSVYTNLDSGEVIRSYVYLFDTADNAKAGIQVVGGNQEETIERTAVELGDDEAVLLNGTYTKADGSIGGTADVAFVRGNAVIGVAVDGAGEAVPDPQLAQDLAARADERAQAVQSGEAPVNLELPKKVVPFAENGMVIQAGYLNATESELIYDTQGSPLASLESSWVKTVGYGENGEGPRLTIGVTEFATAEDAAAVVDQSDRIFTGLTDQQKVDGVSVEGAEQVVAYTYTSEDGSAYRIIFSIGEVVTVVDVQGAPDAATAEAAANSVATAQVTCQVDGTCERPVAEGVIPGE